MFLSLAIWVPIFAGLLVLAVGTNAGDDRKAALQRTIAFVGALAGFLVTIPLYTGFHLQGAGMQFVEKLAWIPRFNIHYHLGVDGISMLFILLNSFITPLVVIAGWTVIQQRVGQYMAAFLIMSGLLNGVFAALDGMLFYVFFEATLIPMFIIIGVWGGANRVYAALKFFLYTFLGSVLMLVSLLYLYNKSGAASRSWTGGTSSRCRSTPRCGCSSACCSPSRSRCRCGRCIPGCRTRTSRRPPAARWCWRRSC